MNQKIKCIFLFIILVLLINTGYNQTFEKLYITEEDDIVYDAVMIDSSTCIFALNKGNYESGSYITKIFKINVNTGFFIDSLTLQPSYQNYIFRGIFDLLKSNDTLIIGIGKFKLEYGNEEIQYILHIDNDLKIQFDTVSNIPEFSEIFQKSILSSDNLIVSVGREMDSLYKILSEKTIYGQLIRFQKYSYNTSHTASAVIDLPGINRYHLYFYLGILHSYYIISGHLKPTDF
jgi:hypothetical protein